MSKHLFPYKWFLTDGYPGSNIAKNEHNVFGTFICGGGSTMGYKLAGFNHLGGVEIDPKIADIYKTNHSPRYLYKEDIREFNKRNDLPNELYQLDILDGSPPCSTFSMAGSREKAWRKKKQFREGQSVQTLDDLVFVYCDTIIKLKPKVFILENVKGIIQGNAKVYSKKIVEKMTLAGYTVQVFCLNAASMGVPQKRERVFFIGHKKELILPRLILEFDEESIPFRMISDIEDTKENLTPYLMELYDKVKDGECFSKYHYKGNYFNSNKASDCKTLPTITSSTGSVHNKFKRTLNKKELCKAGSFPLDYNFKQIEPKYIIGMSVPPVMTAQIANQIKIQWLDIINNHGI